MRQSTSITGCVRLSVGRSVGRVTHSFDDPHVAPYWPTSIYNTKKEVSKSSHFFVSTLLHKTLTFMRFTQDPGLLLRPRGRASFRVISCLVQVPLNRIQNKCKLIGCTYILANSLPQGWKENKSRATIYIHTPTN